MRKVGLLLVMMYISMSTFSQTSLENYLKENNSELNSELKSGKLTGADFNGSQYVLLGEVHGFSDVQDVDLELLKVLSNRYQFRHYIAEMDDAKAWLLNKYLSTGDESLLHNIFKSRERDTAQWANLPYFNKFKKLYEYQRQLPANKKIVVVGIDQPHDYSIVKEYLAFLTQSVKGQQFGAQVEKLSNAIDERNKSAIQASATDLLKNINNEKDKGARALGSNRQPILLLLNNLSAIGKTRDGVMFDNLERYINAYHLQKAKMYGFLGFFHCLQASYNQNSPFAYLLKKTMKNAKVTSIVCYYKDGMIMMPYNAQMKQMIPVTVAAQFWNQYPDFASSKKYIPLPYSNDQSNPMMEKMDRMESLVELTKPSSVYLFKLNGVNSPFRTQKTFAEVKGIMGLKLSDSSNSTTDAFQYLLLFRNPLAAPPK